ncbi:MAG: hypothetical protein Q7J58_13555 [Hydrogenophaga sp.]|uniref:hypothetical protein n=1 Tax=Hydrogenophaga sp. TaxID=1904254 RepID=UPI00271EA7D9|nr:hypothetical protein [Hydrogenophaga sp.]MDO9570380.1 hypothetical protein [Hydrogenophaga sp.]
MTPERSKTEKASWIAGIVSAMLAVITLVYSMWPKHPESVSPVTQNASTVSTQIGAVTGNVTVVNAATSPPISKSLAADKPINDPLSKRFLGALDGKYEAKGNRFEFRWSDRSYSLTQGNCTLIGTIVEKDTHWNVVATGIDGLCSILDPQYFGREVGEIHPERGAMANSGRVLRFLVNFQLASLVPMSGAYELK